MHGELGVAPAHYSLPGDGNELASLNTVAPPIKFCAVNRYYAYNCECQLLSNQFYVINEMCPAYWDLKYLRYKLA